MVTATIPFRWSGHVLVTRRTQIKQALSRTESERPGVYLLVGELDGEDHLYIGETDEIATRIKKHAAEKDWWSTAILITSSGDPLTKAHARYLESRLLSDANQARKINLNNDQLPPERTLSEAAKAHMDDFLSNIHLMLPALRFDFLLTQVRKDEPQESGSEIPSVTRFTLSLQNHDITANASLEDGKFIVQAGSFARKEWVSDTPGYAKLFNELVDQEVLVVDGDRDRRVFSQSYTFQSTSAAAAVIKGRPASGPGSWLVEGTDIKYGEWERNNLSC